MANKIAPRLFRVDKGADARMRDISSSDNAGPRWFRVVKGMSAGMRDIPLSDKTDQRRIRVIKGLGTRIKYHPPKRTEGLQRRTNPTPPNNTNNANQA